MKSGTRIQSVVNTPIDREGKLYQERQFKLWRRRVKSERLGQRLYFDNPTHREKLNCVSSPLTHDTVKHDSMRGAYANPLNFVNYMGEDYAPTPHYEALNILIKYIQCYLRTNINPKNSHLS